MDKIIRKQILEDYKIIGGAISKIINGEDPNPKVLSDHYPHPTVRGGNLPIHYSESMYAHYARIRHGLEILLAGGVLPEDIVILNAPDYIQKANSQNVSNY